MEIEKTPPAEATAQDVESADLKNIKSTDADLALKVYDLDVTEAEIATVSHRKLVRKIDLRLIPIVSCTAHAQYSDNFLTMTPIDDGSHYFIHNG
jgi:hypothetical protein